MTRRQDAAAALEAARAAEQEYELRDRPFDAWRRPASERASELVRWAIGIFTQREEVTAPRRRKRSEKVQGILEEAIAALICDAAHREMTEPGCRIMLPLSNDKLRARSRYRPPVFSHALPHILRVLDGSLLDVRKGHQDHFGKARRTTVALSERFKAHVRSLHLSLDDLRREVGGEVLLLKKARESYWEGGDLLEYEDTPETLGHRERVQRINAWLARLELDFDAAHPRAARVDLGDRTLRRIFNNGRFDHGGRLFGGFWQALKKRERADALLLEGDSAVTLDYRQMAPRLLYARAGAMPPSDCYAVPGYELWRDGWKKLLNAMLFGGPSLGRLPRNTAELLPVRIGIARAMELLLQHNAPIAPLIQKDVGFELMCRESELLIDLLLEMERRDIVALPLHDAITVPEYAKEIAAEVMAEVFRRHTGQRGEVSME